MWNDEKKTKSLRDIIEDAPKTLNREYLQSLHSALFHHKLELDIPLEDIISSLLLIVINKDTSLQVRQFAVVILQKLSPIKGLAEVLISDVDCQWVHVLPVLLIQSISDFGVKDIIHKLFWYFRNENLPPDIQCYLLAFFSKVIVSPNSPLSQDDMKKISSLLSSWLVIPSSSPLVRPPSFRRTSSTLSITEIDGTDTQDFFTVLNYAPVINPQQFRSIQVFSMLRSYLCSSSESDKNNSKQAASFIASFASDSLSFSIREYCLRIMDQVDRSKVQSVNVAEFQKACLVEAIELFNILCLMDSGVVHSIFPIIRRIYDSVYSTVSKDPEVQDVALLVSSMQFYMNHGSSVMHKPDSFYVFLFCDLLNMCYKDNYVSFEILHLMKQNLSQLCYHSSILEKYFPTFFKVLAWRPNTFVGDFVELLPSFMSQHTSVEVFHMLLDLPCLTAILMLMDSKSSGLDPKILRDPSLMEALKKPELASTVKYMLRKSSGNSDYLEKVKILHANLVGLANHSRVVCSSQAVIPLLRRFFKVLTQYADMSMTTLIIPAILERLFSVYPVPNYDKEVHKVLADSILQLFELHPETVFHCQKNIINYISHFKNYFISEQNFIHMIWIVGEYVSNAYSAICRPEVIALFFETLESTTYEALSFLQASSDDYFLKFISISLTTLSKLAARNQDQVPRAILCLSKVHQQLSSFGNDYKKNWRIVIERVVEMLSILNSPNVAAIVLSPPKDLEVGRLHSDSTSLPYVLRAVTGIVSADN